MPTRYPNRCRNGAKAVNEGESHRLILSAPFRTNIEMDTFSALSAADVGDRLRDAVGDLSGTASEGVRWTTEREPGRGDGLLFASLDEHVLPQKAKPIACLQLHGRALERLADGASPAEGASSLRIDDCRVMYYDDTIAILVCTVSLGRLRAGDLGSVDQWSIGFCKSLADKLGTHRAKLEGALLASREARRQRRLFSPAGRLRRFDDRNRGSSQDGRTVLWVNRVLVTEAEPSAEALAAWTQTQPRAADWVDLGSMRLLPCVGNSVLAGPLSERDVSVTVGAVALCTFFYVSQDLFRQRLKDLHLQVARAAKGMSRTSLSDEALGELRDHVVVMEGEFGDCRLGLQGHMREAALRFLKAWNYDALAAAVARRSASLETAWSLLREKRRRRYDGALQSALTVIAGVAVMQFLLALFAAAGDGTVPEDSVPGLIDAARLLPPDLTFHAALVLLLALPLLAIRGRK